MIILAAGLSKRMGAFKPLLPVGGQPAILRNITIAKEAGVSEIIVVTGHKREDIEGIINAEAPDVLLVNNPLYREDMLTSVRAGVTALTESIAGFFMLPADCCAVSADTLKALADGFEKTALQAVVHPVYKGARGHPPLIPSQYTGQILASSGENGLKGILHPFQSVDVETNDRGVLLDMDSPEDYAALLRHLDKR